MPSDKDLQFDGRLTNVAIQYQNPEYIADLVVPPTPVPNEKFTYKQYDKDERFTVPETLVGRKSVPAEVDWNVTEKTGTTKDYGDEVYVSQKDIDNADAPIAPLADATDLATQLIRLDHEKRIADEVFKATNYGTTIDIAGAWATLSTDALTQLEVGIDTCFVSPNVMVMGIETWRKLARNEKVLAAVKGTLAPQALKTGSVGVPAVNQEELASYLGLDAVLVGRARINTAKKGQTASYKRVWDGTNATKGGAALLRVKAGAALRNVVWGANFTWKQRQAFTRGTEKGAYGGQYVRVIESMTFHLVASDVGYLFIDCLVT